MNKTNSIAAPQIVKEVKRVGYASGSSSLIRFLSDNVPLGKLEVHELEWLGGLTDQMAMDLSQLADMAESIGCLVQSDDSEGSFQDRGSIGRLLFTISHGISICAETLQIAGNANAALKLKRSGEL